MTNNKLPEKLTIRLAPEHIKALDDAYKAFIANLQPNQASLTKSEYLRRLLLDGCKNQQESTN